MRQQMQKFRKIPVHRICQSSGGLRDYKVISPTNEGALDIHHNSVLDFEPPATLAMNLVDF
jgi:hypothetical protein